MSKGKYIRTQEIKDKQSISMIGHIVTEETKMKMRGPRPETCVIQKEIQNRPEVKEKKSSSGKKHHREHPERRKNQGISLKKKWEESGFREKYVGKNHHAWIEDRNFLLYPDVFNREFKEYIRERYNYTCVICERKQEHLRRKLGVHHIDYDKNNLNPDNFIPLCDSCHTATNNNRDYWIKVFQNMVEMNKILV